MKTRLRSSHDLKPLSLPQRRLWRSRVPFLVWVPAIVIGIAIAVAAAVTWLGVSQLRRHSDETAAFLSKALGATLAERLSHAAADQHNRLLEKAAESSGAEFILADARGRIIKDYSLTSPAQAGLAELVRVGEGETVTSGRTRFYATRLQPPLDDMYLLTFVGTEELPFATASLIRLVTVFTCGVASIAALVAFALARAVHSDVTYVRAKLDDMARPDAKPTGEQIRIRTIDQVGAMTAAFNELVGRFAAAEQKYREDLARASVYERDRSEFLAALSHELRTPLNVILGFTDVLLSEVDGPLSSEAKENLGVVRESGIHLRSLINDILDLSALESGELQLDRKPTDVYKVADNVLREARLAAERKGLALELRGGEALAFADPLRVRQIVNNLVGNAIKFTSQGRIVVAVERESARVKLSVSDTGPGIAEPEQAAIFEEYTQAGDAKTKLAGTGLGLAITRRLVRMHGGTIQIQSALGRGSTFIVRLPARSSGPPTPPPRSSRPGTLTVPPATGSGTNQAGPPESASDPARRRAINP